MQGLALRRDDIYPEIEVVHPQSAFCITLYNERLACLKRTLSSILASVEQHHRTRPSAATEVCLCIMIDGAIVADPAVLKWLRDHGMIRWIGDASRPYQLHVSAISAEGLSALLDDQGAGDRKLRSERLRMIVCVKGVNCGKLHSHAVFFREICPWLDPTFCFQIDAGTVIGEGAYAALMERMEDETDIGALAPCIMTPAPHARSIFLSTWQFMDFVLQKSLLWPVEAAAGHLSVVPGQFCVFRWGALRAARQSDEAAGAAGSHDPIDAYLRGLLTDDPLEKVMFLAEDRVIGNEIVLRASETWRLTYSPEANAVTDACDTLEELMRQRRRWNNSALACRLALLLQLPTFLARGDRTVGEKLRFAVAMCCQAVLMLIELGAPALAFAATLAVANVIRSAAAANPALAVGVGVAMATMLAAALLGGRWRAGRSVLVGVRNGASVVASLAMVGLLFRDLPPLAIALMATPAALGIAAVAMTNVRWLPQVMLLHNIYAAAGAVLTPLLSAYSIMNMHDVSWGTKGLTSSRLGKARIDGMRRLRATMVGCWAVLNLGLLLLATKAPGLTSGKLNLVFEVTCALGGLGAFLALAHLNFDRWIRRGRVTQTASESMPVGAAIHG